ncbi:class I SAM-dependent methyltransferase [Candidatus Woesearchaeota archaeon]|nr:class I SAM-dependent methyltransferase [Candidatus Woesearchaeota archaeon]
MLSVKFVLPKDSQISKNIEEQDCTFAYYSKNPFLRWAYTERLRQASALIPEKTFGSNSCVLDLGTGCGFMLPTLSKKGKIVALDFNEGFLKKAKIIGKENNLDALFVRADIRHLPFQDSHFSLINALSILEHIKNINEVMLEIRRVIKSNGLLIVGLPVERFLVNILFKSLSLRDNIKKGKFTISKGYRKNKYQDVHYSDFKDIETALSKYFEIKRSKKIFSNYAPDAFCLYKVYLCAPK